MKDWKRKDLDLNKELFRYITKKYLLLKVTSTTQKKV